MKIKQETKRNQSIPGTFKDHHILCINKLEWGVKGVGMVHQAKTGISPTTKMQGKLIPRPYNNFLVKHPP